MSSKKLPYRSKPRLKSVDRSAVLTDRGREILDPVPLATDLIGTRPMTMKERLALFSHSGTISHQLVYDDFADDDDFHDHMDGLPDYGITPHEIGGGTSVNLERFNRKKKRAPKLQEPSPELPSDSVTPLEEAIEKASLTK